MYRKQLIFITVILLVSATGIYAISKLIPNPVVENNNEDIPISSPISYAQEKLVEEEGVDEEVGQVEGVITVIQTTPIQVAPQTSHINPILPSVPNLPIITNPDPQPVPIELPEEDRCSKPENTWLEINLGSSAHDSKMGGNGTQYTYEERTSGKIVNYKYYSCIEESEMVEVWYNATLDEVHCYCGEIYLPNVKPGTHEMIYILSVRGIVFYDYISLTIAPLPPRNERPDAVILTPHGYFETIIVEGSSHTFDLYGEMSDPEDGIVSSGSTLKWYRYIKDQPLEYLFDSSGSYTVEVENCSKVEVSIVLRVWDSGNYMDDEVFTVFLKNENCTEVVTN